MRYHLPADVPVTWSSPAEVRVGGSNLGRIFPDHPAVHAMLAALKLGTDERFLRTLARSHALDRARIDAVVAGLLEISVPSTGAGVARSRVLVRTVPTAVAFAQLIAREFTRRHLEVALVGAEHPGALENAGLVIEVAEFVVPTRRYLPLLARDLPHLAVVRDIDGLQIGPLVVPGATPCLRCEDLAKLSRHPEWPAVATQLLDSPPVTLASEIEWLGALQIGLLGAAFLTPNSGAPPLAFTRELIDAKSGEITVSPRHFHAGCGCRVPRQTETARPDREHTTTADVVSPV